MNGGQARPLSWRTHCGVCGGKKAKRWSADKLALAKYCQNPDCRLFGMPNLVSIQRIITIDRLGRRHVRVEEVLVRRRPTFTIDPIGMREPTAAEA